MKLKLTYLNPANQESQEVVVNTPVAIGWDVEELPIELAGQEVSRVLVSDDSISPYHALVEDRQGQIIVKDVEHNCPIGISKNRFTVGKIKFTFVELSPEIAAEDAAPSAENSSDKCQKMVGFLFKRPCDRTSSLGCPHCNTLDNVEDYASDYVYYENYGRYDTWGHTYYRDRHYYHYDYDRRRVEFTEADNVAFESESDRDFERDYSAS